MEHILCRQFILRELILLFKALHMKSSKTKIIWASVLVISLVAGIGCKKFLDRKPLGTATENDITQGGLEDKVYGLYGSLRNWGMSDLPRTWFKSIRSDDAVKGSTPGDLSDAGAIMDQFQYSKDH